MIKSICKSIPLILFVVTASQSMAGFTKGNGGNTVVCELQNNNTVQYTAELLDLYEDMVFENRPQLDLATTDTSEYFNIIWNRINQTTLAKSVPQLQTWAQNFLTEALMVEGADLGEVNDSFHFIVPKNCQIKQTVLQVIDRELLPHESRYLVQKDYWNLLNTLDQTALITHEILYRHLFEKNKNDSQTIRKLVALLYLKDFTQDHIDEINQILTSF